MLLVACIWFHTMNLLRLFLAVLLVAGSAFGAENSEPVVVVVPIQGEVSQAQFFFLRRALKEAERQQAEAVILEMDTYGGELRAATRMLDALFAAKVPTYTFINPNAGSAGALIALGTKHIYMAPVSAVGAAAPVLGGGQEMPATVSEKVISYFSKYFRSAAERNGHNPDVAEAFINKEKEVKIGAEVISAKGALLSLSAQEAARVIDGKPVLAAGIADSVKEVLSKAGLKGSIKRMEPTGFEHLAFWVTMLAPLFLLGGILGAYIEFKTPGFGVPGILSAICFLIFFTGHYLAGLAGSEVFALFLLGVVLVVIELVLFPGSVAIGLAGVVLMVGSLLWAMVDRYPSQPLIPAPEMLIRPLANLGIAGVLGVLAIGVLARFLPKTPFYRGLVLAASSASGPSLSAGSLDTPVRIRVGAEGRAVTMLRPSGKAEFGELLADVVTEGEFLEAETPVRVLAVEGSRVVVEARR